MGLPSLTSEEELLLNKYVELKKKKKALMQLKQSKNKAQNATEPPVAVKRPVPENAIEAMENAKKLLASGAVKIDVPTKSTGFKRSKNYEQKLKDPDKGHHVTTGFQPFQTGSEEPGGDASSSSSAANRPQYKPLYNSFVSGGTSSSSNRRDSGYEREPKKGNTIYVKGHNITKEICQKVFGDIGTIINISAETEKHCAFVTFDKEELAEEAIKKFNGEYVSNMCLTVSIARKQPTFDNGTNTSVWATVGFSKGEKRKESRDLVSYDEEF